MKAQLRAAAIQLTTTRDVAASLGSALGLVREAADAGAELIALPENYAFLGSEEEKLSHAQSVDDGPFIAPLRELARDRRIAILAGSVPEQAPDRTRTFNTSVLIGRSGETIASYRKIHLFDVDLEGADRFTESTHVSPGSESVTGELDGWVIGLSVCYDLRFPELYRALSKKGAELMMVPSAFTLHTGKDHWETLVRARAIENLCYVIAPGQFGQNSKSRRSWGKSMIVDPWGSLLAMAPERPCFVMATLDAEAQEAFRRQVPSLDHRRL